MLNQNELLNVLEILKDIEGTEEVKEARRSTHRLLSLDVKDVQYAIEQTSLKILINEIIKGGK